MAEQSFQLRGQVVRSDRQPFIAGIVRAFHLGGADTTFLGEDDTDNEGRYTIRYPADRVSGAVNLSVRVYDPQNKVLAESTTIQGASAEEIVNLVVAAQPGELPFSVQGFVRSPDGLPLPNLTVQAFDKDLRREQVLGEAMPTRDGEYTIRYSDQQFRRADKGRADLVVKAFAADGALLVTSPVLFNAPPSAKVDLTLPPDAAQPTTLFEKIVWTLAPLLDDLRVEELEEDQQHQDLSFLTGETGFDKESLARFVLAHLLAQQGIQAEFWFVLLGGSLYEFTAGQSLQAQLVGILDTLPGLDEFAVRKALARGFNQQEIAEAFQANVAGWVEAFLQFVAYRIVGESTRPSFVKLAVEDAGIQDIEKQASFVRLFNQYKAFTPELLAALQQEQTFTETQIADLHTSFHLADLTRSDFSVVKMLKADFNVRQPEQIRTLARQSEGEWVNWVVTQEAAGTITLPIAISACPEVAGQETLPVAEMYGKTLERQFRQAYPTTAFSGGLGRALQNGGAQGLRRAQDIDNFLAHHESFEFLNTPVDDFLKNSVLPEFQTLAQEETFRLEVKAVQRVFKLAPTFAATDALLADDLHSAQKIYRLGETQFVRRYAGRAGFTTESARLAWNRAADTHAAVVTILADLSALQAEGLPLALNNGNAAIETFPNWDNLFQGGDLCECEHCRSVLSPAAYFADILMFLKDRDCTPDDPTPVKDILFARRPDLGYLELNCDNALTPLPYIDVVCEVLEDVVDAAGENDLELVGFTAIPIDLANPTDLAAARAAVADAFALALVDPVNDGKEKIALGDNFSLSQIDPSLAPNHWVAHGDDVTYLLKKKAPSPIFFANFFAKILSNTKASAAELRAYPQYVNPKAYDKLRAAKYPLTLPFDLFAEEVRAAFQKSNLQRWDLMRTLHGPAAPNNPTAGEIAAEYFGISADAAAAFDEKRLILVADATDPGQQAVWGESDAGWLATVGNVANFLQKTGLEYNDMLALLDLKFINPLGDSTIVHLNASCDLDQKAIEGLDAEKLDRIHRFLRLWRKLNGWKLWELDLVIRHSSIGNGALDEPFLLQLFSFSRLRKRLGGKTTVEQVCALFGNLNTETHFTKLYEKRADALYQSLFLNKRLIQPLDPAFQLDPGTGDLPAGATITDPVHQPVVLAALGIREADLLLFEGFEGLTKASDDTPYLTLANLSFLWRHAWLAKLLKFKAEEWSTVLKIIQQGLLHFSDPLAAWAFVEEIDDLKAAGFKPDELNWLLAADRTATAAPKEIDVTRFLTALRTELQAIQAEYDPMQYPFLTVDPATDEAGLTALLTTLLQKLNRDEAAVDLFLKTLRGSVVLESSVQGLPIGFTFPPAITAAPNHIPIFYDEPNLVLRFTGMMTAAQRTTLLSEPSLAANSAYTNAIEDLFQQSLAAGENYVFVEVEVSLAGVILPGNRPSLPIRYNSTTQKLGFTGVMTNTERLALNAAGNPAEAIDELFRFPRLAIKFFEPIFEVPLAQLPAAADFKADLATKIVYDVEQRLLRFTGIMNNAEQEALNDLVLNVLPEEVAYHAAIDSLATQPLVIAPPDDRIWLTESDLHATLPANDTLPKRLANAASKALAYLAKISAEHAVVQQGSAQFGLTEALTRRLLDSFAVMPPIPPDPAKTTLLAHLTRSFGVSTNLIDDYATQPTTFDGWYWAGRVATLLNKWKLTLAEVEKITALTNAAQLLDFRILPLNDTEPIAPIGRFLRTSRLLRLRDSLPETAITLLEVLEKIQSKTYTATVTATGLPTGFTFPTAITAAPHHIPIQYGEQYDDTTTEFRFTGLMTPTQRTILLTDPSLAAVTGIATYQQAIEDLFDLLMSSFTADVEGLNEAWLAADMKALILALDLAYPADYVLAESWERLRRAFSFLANLNAGADTVKPFAAAAMTAAEAQTLKALLGARFGVETWLTLSTEIQDALRERKRDALNAYLLTQPQPADAPSGKWENTNDLYAYYLLDVEMAACQLTSRLVQGSGSVQLFVQRCFMGLEPEVVVKADGDEGDSAWLWWKWMRKYRVWEANCKVFLWPENWIEPELKPDRSSFFKDMENELLQNEINQYTVETAFSNYLEKLDGVAQLEIAGFYQEDNDDIHILHVFGRTTGAEPHLYYYRRYDYRQWTPWEKVELDIQGDYLIPAVVSKRLFLFWPVFTEMPDESGNSTVTIPAITPDPQTGTEVPKTWKRLKLQMAVSDYRQGKWTPKKVSKDFDLSDVYYVDIVKKHYHFLPIDRSVIDGRFVVKYTGYSLGSDGAGEATLYGAFEIAGCKGVPELTDPPNGVFTHIIRPEWASVGSDTTFLKWVELGQGLDEFGSPILRHDDPENDFTLRNHYSNQSDSLRLTPVLDQTPWIFKMTPPWQLSYFDELWLDGLVGLGLEKDALVYLVPTTGTWLPFFYNDKKRTFFVLPTMELDSVRQYYPEIQTSFRQWEDFWTGLVYTWVDNFDLTTLTPEVRENLAENCLQPQFPEEPPPPYTDEQFKNLSKRYYMRSVHYRLGGLSLLLFQSRQFHFKNFYHPFVCNFAELVNNPLKGIPALMSRETQLQDSGFSFDLTYQPTDEVIELPAEFDSLQDCYPRENVDFTPNGAYAPYNWELFFHVPLLIANALSKNQRFEEARDWYHYIFNPIGVESAMPGGSPMSKYWITKPFFETTDPQYVEQRIDNILRLLAGDPSAPGYSAQAQADLESAVIDWRTYPFEPHRIANYRTVAYQKTVVMKYLDNLIAWGDNLFRQDSMESINEATQLYILAAEILGPRPQKVPPQAKPPLESFNELETQLDAFSNAWVEVENLIPALPGTGGNGGAAAPVPMLYFCIPQNDKLLGYWDTVADRLYKIRHCMNIEGVVRQLALFEPPIDPGALVKAVAGGLDIGAALADLNAPLPLYRFNVLLQKANEVCNDVKALGGALLAALEKKDAEAMGLLRQSQEIRLLEAVKAVREQQIDEAKENLAALKTSKELADIKKKYYESREYMNAGEITAIALSTASTVISAAIAVGYALAGGLKVVPQFIIGGSGFGGSPHATGESGGKTAGEISEDAALTLSALSTALDKGAAIASTLAGYGRRQDEWDFQAGLAAKEQEQIDKQITAADLRIAIVEKELENHVLQIENAKATDAFMRSKYTNQELYQWQVGQISGVYFQSYKLAYDLAKRAERCFRFELGLQASSYINFGYWDSLKKGLLSAEKLQYDLRRLETAYLEQNRREFELTKHISLALLDPLALVMLRETGSCFLRLPEELFDLDYPGHYFRRIKSVSLTLPCVVGPYTTIPCTLRLLKNSIRINTKDADKADNYPHHSEEGLPTDDDRFIENNIPVKAIAASNAQNDSGVFELSFRDERYLPFENAGVISEWSLELFNDLPANNPDPANPDFGKDLRQFDYGTISDVILHVKYTAREDAGVFKNGAIAHLRDYFYQDGTTPALRMFNLRQEFPTQWRRFLYPTNPANGNIFELEMSSNLFPIRDAEKTLKVNTLWLLARCTDPGSYEVVITTPAGSNTMTLAPVNQYGGLHFSQKDGADITIVPTVPPDKWQLTMTGGNLPNNPDEVEDLLLVLGYEWE